MTPAGRSALQRTWLAPVLDRPAAPVQLLCMPHAGGGPAVFGDWPAELGFDVEVLAAQLPGRPPRLGEDPVPDVTALARAIADEASRRVDRRYALFGHSMGALLAFEVACALRHAGAPAPDLLIVSARSGPSAHRLTKPISQLPAPRFRSELRRLGGTPAEVLANRDLMRVMTRALRADFAACERYRYQRRQPLDCPIVAVAGTDDPFVDPAGVHAWSSDTAAGLTVHWIESGHFYTGAKRTELLTIVSDAMVAAAIGPEL